MGYSSGASLTPDLPRKLAEVDMEGVYLLTSESHEEIRAVHAGRHSRPFYWLRRAGFSQGQQVHVEVAAGTLVLRGVTESAEVPADMR